MHKSKIKQISLAVCLAFMPLSGFAAGLGKLNVNSGLGEPLKAEIELISVSPEELATLSATIASEEAYAVQGISRLGIHSNIKVELAKNLDGSPVLKLQSYQPVNDPYLDMLIQVDWASGRLLREYTILLDPPEYKQTVNESLAKSTVINKPMAVGTSRPAASSSNINADAYAETPQTAVKTKKSKKSGSKSAGHNEVAASAQESSANTAEGAELTTQRGDTLNSIAKEMQVEGISLDQMLVGLFEANKKAFVDGNMNRLKVGQIIKVPSKDDLVQVNAKQAAQAIKVHSANWSAYRSSLAGNVMSAPVAEESDQKQSASGKITSAEDKAAVTKPGAQDVVKLSAGNKLAAKDGKAGADYDAKVLALQEEATSREKALKESKERTAALEAQIADMQKLLALKSQAMAGLQKNAEATAKPAQTKTVEATPAKAPEPAAAGEQPKAAETAPQAVAKPAEQKPAEVSAEQKTAVQEVKKASKATKKPVPVAPEAEPTFIDSLLESLNLAVLGGAAGVTLLGAGWMFLRNKRRKDLDSFERGILTSGGLRANTVFGNTTGSASTSDTSFLTDFAQSADGTMIDTNDVDPIAEAEVYMAYGRDAQAEEILKDAISKEPKRYELHLKLLEMYAARKDISAFEAIAGELYTTLGADDPIWARVAELGATVEPDNPLYDLSQLGASVHAVAVGDDGSGSKDADLMADEGLDFSFDDELVGKTKATVAEAEVQNPVSADAEQDQLSGLPSLNGEAAAVVANEANDLSPAPADDNALSFNMPDLGSLDLETETPKLSDAGAAEQDSAQELIFDSKPVEAPAAVSAEDKPDTNEFGLDFNFPEAAVAEETPASTTLENSPEFADINPEPDAEKPAEEISFNVADFNFDGLGSSVAQVGESKPEQIAVSEETGLDISDFNFDEFNAAVSEQPVQKLEGISLDLPAEEEVEPTHAAEESIASAKEDAAKFDFSSISLDLSDEGAKTAEAEATAVVADTLTQAENENPDVDIKLDLVKVYIDMDDKEGARELLDEVLKEGGPQQKIRAEEFLAKLA